MNRIRLNPHGALSERPHARLTDEHRGDSRQEGKGREGKGIGREIRFASSHHIVTYVGAQPSDGVVTR